MNAIAERRALLAQRSAGSVDICMGRHGLRSLREDGSAKCRLPRNSRDAILINTSGGLAGGDHITISAVVEKSAHLCLTTQAAERVYRTVGPPAEISVSLTAHEHAVLFWVPQESILFNGSSLARRLSVNVSSTATLLGVETMVFGRQSSGEMVHTVSIRDHWMVRRDGKLVHAEALALGPDLPSSPATLDGAAAMATVLLVSPTAGTMLEPVRRVLGGHGGASAWNGKMVARLLARDALSLRKTLIQVISACAGRQALPRIWTL